jgi:hypothetical protein
MEYEKLTKIIILKTIIKTIIKQKNKQQKRR